MFKKTLQKDIYLKDLFHYNLSQKRYSELKKGLKEYRFLLVVASMAIKHLQDGDFEKFDSLVGENACQIRAIKIVLMASSDDYFHRLVDLQLKITKISESIDQLLEPSSIDVLMKQGCSLQDVINQNKLDVLLTYDEMFLVQSYLLCEMKECQSDGEFLPSILRMERCSPSTIQKKYPEISYSFIEKLAKKLRVLLSMSSVDFVRNVALDLKDISLMKMVAKEFELEHNKLTCIPTFWSFKILFSLLQKKHIPLVFHIKFLNQEESGYRVMDEEFLYFKSCSIKKTYLEIDPEEADLVQPACIIQGVIRPEEGKSLPSKDEWKQMFCKHSVIDTILAMGADHRQYPNPDHTISVDDDEYEYYKKLAEGGGFALSNPTTFFIQHIYCSQAIRKMPVRSE